MSIDAVRLSDWLRMATTNPRLPRIRQIEICQTFPNNELTTASVLDWDESEPIPRVEDLIHDITTRCQNYAEGKAEGTIRFIVQAYHGKDHNPWGTKFPCYVVARSPEAETASFGQSEPASPQGLLAQLMRHLEKREDMLVKVIETTGRQQTKIMADLQTKNDVYEGRHFDTIKLYEDLLDRKHDRELTALFRAREDQRKAKIWDLVMSLGPMIVSKFFDPRLIAALPGQVTDGGPAMHMIRQLTKSIDQSQLPALMQALTPEQTMMLMELHRLVDAENERENKQEEEFKNVVPTSASEVRRQRDEATPPSPESEVVVNAYPVSDEPMPTVPPEEPEPKPEPKAPEPSVEPVTIPDAPAPKRTAKKAAEKKPAAKKAAPKKVDKKAKASSKKRKAA